MQTTKNIFIIGSKGIPANYGGFETFVENLTSKRINQNIQYNIACIGSKKNEFVYNNARCFTIKVPNIGSAKAVYYDIMALKKVIKYIEKERIKNAIIYVLACRIGPFVGHYKKKITKLGAKLYVNPDGHEWKRAKWNLLIKKYWKISERLMVKHADLMICDSLNIEKYIKEDYKKYNPNTVFIPYGSDTANNELDNNDEKIVLWYKEKEIKPNEYYLMVGRFVPENNLETIVKEYMKSNSKKDLVLITNYENNKFFKKMKKNINFEEDKRIKFVGTVYDSRMLKNIRKNAYGYLHGHSVGGTNPSLIEALAITKLNLLYDVGFNREVGKNGAFYWNLNDMNLANLIDKCDKLNEKSILKLSELAKKRVNEEYTWKKIIADYEKLFTEGKLGGYNGKAEENDFKRNTISI